MKKILVPTDFSANAYRAMEFALQIGVRLGAAVHVLHVIPPNPSIHNAGDYSLWIDEYIEQRKFNTQQWASNFKQKQEYMSMDITAETVMGFPVEVILDKAEGGGFDLIVIGTTGATGLLSGILGSVTAGVVGKSEIPVLTIPPNAIYKPTSPYVFATDFRANLDKRALNTLKSIVQVQGGKMHVVHVQNANTVKPESGIEARFKEKLSAIDTEFNYLSNNKIETAVDNFVTATDAGGLVTVSHEHTLFYKLFHDSISHSLVWRSEVPVLVMKDAKILNPVLA